MPLLKIQKRNGAIVDFDIEKIEKARFPKDQQKTPDANQQAWTGTTTTNKTSHLLVKIGSLAAILIILLIIYLSLLQHV